MRQAKSKRRLESRRGKQECLRHKSTAQRDWVAALTFRRQSLERTGKPVFKAALFILLLVVVLGGCESEPQPAGADVAAIEKRYEEGSLTVTARVNRDEITVAERVELSLTAISSEDQQARFPEIENESLGEFRVVNTRNTPPKLLQDGRLQTEKIYELEPFLPGEYSIPPVTIVFRAGAGDEGSEQTIETESMRVKVRSVLPESEEEPDIVEASGPVEIPGFDPWVYWLVAGLVVLALLGGLYYWRKGRTKVEAGTNPPLPHEVAHQELEKLLAEDLIGKGQSKLFYLRLSNILRRYIEDRFGLQAPERTTEEFLIDLRGSDALERRHKDLLRAFLEHCDLVKFAEHQASADEIERTVGACKQFIAETVLQPEPNAKTVAVAQ